MVIGRKQLATRAPHTERYRGFLHSITSPKRFGGAAMWSGAVNGLTGLSLGVYQLATTVLASRRATIRLELAAYPNPSPTGEFRLPLPGAAATVRLTDAVGRELWRTSTPGSPPR